MTDEELDELRRNVATEQERRQVLKTAPSRMKSLVRDLLHAEGVKEGDAWAQPTGYENAYPEGWVVTHDGGEWASNIGGNTLEPGVSGWTKILAEGEAPPEFKAPAGYEGAYHTGDRVTFEGEVYESSRDGNTWSPTENPAGWTKI